MVSIVSFIEALQEYDFLQSALLAAMMVGITSGLVGTFIILRGMSLMGDAISHAVLPGVAVAYMLGINLIFGASVFGILAAALIGWISNKSKLKNDTVIGIVFSAFFALGFIVIANAKSTTNLHHILFGNVLAVTKGDLYVGACVMLFVVVLTKLFFKELQITSFDETFAKIYGIPTTLMHYGLMFVLTIVTVTALQTVGVILVVAMLITPAATAFLWTQSLGKMLLISTFNGWGAAVLGFYLSYTFNWASGPAIVLVAALWFLISFLVAPKQGLIVRSLSKG